MKRLFGKSSQQQSESKNDENRSSPDISGEGTEEIPKKESKGKKVRDRDLEKTKKSVRGHELGEGDAAKARRGRHKLDGENIDSQSHGGTDNETIDTRSKHKSKPRPHEIPVSATKDDYVLSADADSDGNVPSSRTRKSKTKENPKKLKSQNPKSQHRSLLGPEFDSEESIRFVQQEELGYLPKVEPGKSGDFLASFYNYKQPMSSFRIRARLLKYPTFVDQEVWPGDFAVVDDRIFAWQEKVFSKSEAKWYQKEENCKTDQERKYHQTLQSTTDSIGNFLYSYVSECQYSTKKKLKTLIRKCPVDHIKGIEKRASKAINSDGDSVNDALLIDNDDSDDSFDFDKPVSSSTPKTKRRQNKEAQEMVKVEKKVRAKEEKESREHEKQSKKLKDINDKKDKAEEKKRNLEEAKEVEKARKHNIVNEKEKELKEGYVKKYNYSKRPSLPLGVRLRSVQLSPSPKKLIVRHKAQSSSKLLTQGVKESVESKEDNSRSKSNYSENSDEDELARRKSSGRLGYKGEQKSLITLDHHENGRPRLQDISGRRRSGIQNFRNERRKFYERLKVKHTQTMFIMASIPYMAKKSRNIVICMIQNLPEHGVIMFKPTLGYRNIEAKRNNVFRISCELYPSGQDKKSEHPRYGIRNSAGVTATLNIPMEFGTYFETVPKSELRLTVMGEIITAEGFESSPICVYYLVDIPKGWRNDSISSNIEGITQTCFTNQESVAHFSHEFSFQLVFSMDLVEESNCFPTPVILLMVVSMNHSSPRILHEGYGYVCIPSTPGSHLVKIRTWKPCPRTTLEKMREAFLNITPSLQDMKFAHVSYSQQQDCGKANLVGLHTTPSGTVKMRFHVLHQTPTILKDHEKKLDLLEKMSSATILKSVQAVIEAFQRARHKALNLKNQYE